MKYSVTRTESPLFSVNKLLLGQGYWLTSYSLYPCRLIGPGRSCDEEDEVELYHVVVMAGLEHAH